VTALRVLGVDPGTVVAGWGVLEAAPPTPAVRLGSGVWKLGGRQASADRLLVLRRELEQALERWQPDLLAVEAAFFGRNARSALRLGEARGVILVGAAAAGVAIEEIPPALVKRRVGGSGVVSKEGMAALVAAQLGMEPRFASFDESDALSVALCAVLERQVPEADFGHNGGGLPRGAGFQ